MAKTPGAKILRHANAVGARQAGEVKGGYFSVELVMGMQLQKVTLSSSNWQQGSKRR